MAVTAAAGQKSAHSSPRAVSEEPGSQMEKFTKTALSDSSAHELSNERKKYSVSQEWQVNSAWNVYCTKPWKERGVLWKINSIPTHEAGKAIHMKETQMETTDYFWKRREKH